MVVDVLTVIPLNTAHPDTEITPIKLREIRKRLKRYYGWSEEVFYRAL